MEDNIYAIFDCYDKTVLDISCRSIEQGVKYIIAKEESHWNKAFKDDPYFIRYKQQTIAGTPTLELSIHSKEEGFIIKYIYEFIKLTPIQCNK